MDMLRAMRLLVRVSQAGSLSAAGRESGLAVASVFRHIAALEAAVGTQLLHRTTRHVALTDAGRTYLEKVTRILAEIDATHAAMSELDGVPRGTLHVLSAVLVGVDHIAPMIPRFATMWPEVKVSLTLSDAHRLGVTDHEAEVVICSGFRPRDSSLLVRKLASAPRMLCASPAYLRRHPPPMVPQDLLGHACIVYRPDAAPPLWRFRTPEGVEEVRPVNAFQTNNGAAIRSMMLDGLGIGLMPEWSVKSHLLAGRLLQVLPDHAVSTRSPDFEHELFIVYPRDSQRSRKTRVFVDFALDGFRRLQRDGWMPPGE